MRNESQETPLHRAAYAGEAPAAEFLIQRGANVNAIAYNNFTPLHLAANVEVARVLIKAGANVTTIDSWGNTPLQMAVQDRKLDVVDAMLESGQSLDLASAVMLDKRDVVRDILDKNADALKGAGGGASLWGNKMPLGLAASKGDLEMVQWFLDAGANVNGGNYMPNAGGTATPLCNAVWSGHAEIVQLLFEKGASWEGVGGKFYESIFHYAVRNSEPRIVRLFLEHGAKIERTWPGGAPTRTSLLSEAAKSGSDEKVALVLDHAPGVYSDADMRIALLDAAEAGHAGVVQALRARGVAYDVIAAFLLGDEVAVEEFLKNAPDAVNARDERFGRPLLTWAVLRGKGDLAARLIQSGADVNARTVRERFYGETLHFGPVTEADVRTKEPAGESALQAAMEQKDFQTVRRLMDAGAEVSGVGEAGQSPLHLAVQAGDLEFVNAMIKRGAELNARDVFGSTPLHRAGASKEVATALLDAGADVNARDGDGRSPIDWARGWSTGVADLLAARGAEISLETACVMGRLDVVLQHLEKDAAAVDTDFKEDLTRTPLTTAAFCGHLELARFLLEHGATVNFADNRRTTPLHAAAEKDNVEMLKLLLASGADLKASSYQGTALHRAAMYGQLEAVRLLLDTGGDVNAQAQGGGWTPLVALASWTTDNVEVAELLIARGADVKSRDKRGRSTPLHATTTYGNVNVARILLAHGVEVNARDSRGQTPLAQAARDSIYAREDENVRDKRAQLVELLKASGGVE